MRVRANGRTPGVVYLMQRGDGLIKIGRTAQPVEARRASASREHSTDFRVIHTIASANPGELERALHRPLRPFRRGRGREVFSLPPRIVEALRSASTGDEALGAVRCAVSALRLPPAQSEEARKISVNVPPDLSAELEDVTATLGADRTKLIIRALRMAMPTFKREADAVKKIRTEEGRK